MVTTKPTTHTKAHRSTPPELAGYFPHRLPESRASARVLRHDRRLGGEICARRLHQAEVPIPALFFMWPLWTLRWVPPPPHRARGHGIPWRSGAPRAASTGSNPSPARATAAAPRAPRKEPSCPENTAARTCSGLAGRLRRSGPSKPKAFAA